MVKMDEYAKMVDDDDEVDALESRDVEELAAHRMDRMGARHKISRDPSRHDMLRVRRLVLLTFFSGLFLLYLSCQCMDTRTNFNFSLQKEEASACRH